MILADMQFETRAHARQSIEALGYRPRKFVEAGQLFGSKRFNSVALRIAHAAALWTAPASGLRRATIGGMLLDGQPGPNRQAEIDVAAGKCRELASPFLPLLSC